MEASYAEEKPSLLNLPVELSFMISEWLIERTQQEPLSTYKDKLGDLLNLSLTCKTLAQTCAPTLYKRVVLSDAMSTLQFLKGVLRKPFLKDYVRVLVTAEPPPPSERKKSKKSKEPEDAAREETKETTKVVKSDRVAAKLLSSGAFRLQVLVVVRILQHLPELTQLSTIRTISQVVRWPEKERLIGSSIIKLQFSAADDGFAEQDVSSWMRAFQPGRGPTALESFHLDCKSLHPSQFSSPSHPLDGDLREFAASLQEVSLGNVTRDNFPALSFSFKHYPHLIAVRVSSDSVSLSDMLAALASSPNLTNDLRVLEISGSAGSNDYHSKTLKHLPKFSKLTSLSIPMLYPANSAMPHSDIISPAHYATTWPPHLVSLTLSQMDLYEYLGMMVQVVDGGLLPTSLRSITLKWGYDYLQSMHKEYDATQRVVRTAVVLDQVCNSKDIALLHFVDMPPSIKVHESERHPSLAELKTNTLDPMLQALSLIDPFDLSDGEESDEEDDEQPLDSEEM